MLRRAFFYLATVVVALGGCSRNEQALAIVGSRVITEKDFIKRYDDFRRRIGGVPDNEQTRRQVLQNYVDEELLILAAEQRGYAGDREGRHERERLEIQELLNAFNREFIAGSITINEDELERLFINLNTRVKARHLYAPTKPQADSLYLALQNGASFEQLARGLFKDPALRDSGGSLGYFTVDEMEPAFEEAAYNLKVGEISKPVRTLDGYSIIRVDDRVTNPLLTESEYVKHRDKLEGYWRVRKIQAATAAYVDSLRRSLDLSFNEPAVKKLFALLKTRQGDEALIEAKNFWDGDDEFGRQELLRSKLGVWEVATFQDRLRFTSAREHQWIRSEETLKDFIAGLVAREAILAKARAARLDRRPEYKRKVEEKFDSYLLERIETSLRREMRIPEDSLRAYYRRHAERFAAPVEENLHGRLRSFDEARPEVEATLRMMYWDEARRRHIEEIRKNTRVAVYPERLMTLRLN
ncbi:MAG: peptidylprolyl isomerase [candidate division KSB1 bacterium]|nr:peptidylprolyl isomerase [candidate division KSB1 bacterium]MDZ7365124.1 peptidylprolyl isomerase [candidate division KSB1 bacterium]MDZ7404334.1 peptidylprolyl isomerase [candidate division KSB1 bacterium]